MKYLLIVITIALVGCDSAPESEPGRWETRYDGVLLFNATGLDAFGPPLSGLRLDEGYAGWWIHHPLNETGQPEPARLEMSLQMGPSFAWIPEPRWGHPGELRIRIRQASTTALGTRTLFTDDIESVALRREEILINTDDDGEPYFGMGRRFAGEAELEVFAADLVTGAAWGRLHGELWPLDGADGPYPIQTEFVAAALSDGCAWEVPAVWPEGTIDITSTPPAGRADDCTPALAAMQAAPVHPDAPPLPGFAEHFGMPFLPDRWPGLDRDL